MHLRHFLCILLLASLSITPCSAFYYQTTSLSNPRQMYGTCVLGDYVYLVGGNNQKEGYTPGVLKSPILQGGMLGQWTSTTAMPNARSYISNTTLALNDMLYIVGGFDGRRSFNTQSILWTRPQANGDLGRWQESTDFPGEGVSCSVAVSTPGHLHLIAGYTNENVPTDKVWTAFLNEKGDFIGWKEGPSLPGPRWFHNAAVVGEGYGYGED